VSIRVGFPKVRDIKIGKQRIYALKANKKEESWAIDTTKIWKSYGTWKAIKSSPSGSWNESEEVG
jgi:hypothetical protein